MKHRAAKRRILESKNYIDNFIQGRLSKALGRQRAEEENGLHE